MTGQLVVEHALRIATFNVNDVNRRLTHVLDWLAATRPDAACL